LLFLAFFSSLISSGSAIALIKTLKSMLLLLMAVKCGRRNSKNTYSKNNRAFILQVILIGFYLYSGLFRHFKDKKKHLSQTFFYYIELFEINI
jgi:hypothetical protein